MNIAIYTLTSELHNEEAVRLATKEFLATITLPYSFYDADYTTYGQHALNLIYVRTGGTEGVFLREFQELKAKCTAPFYLLTSGKSNSLAASMEILSYLRQQGVAGEIIHGTAEYINRRIDVLLQVNSVRQRLRGMRLGIIGKPSDWLISSVYDKQTVRQVLGIELVDIPISEVENAYNEHTNVSQPEPTGNEQVDHSLGGAQRIYEALKTVTERHRLGGFTLRCFDLLGILHNTGCLGLAKLNAEGFIAGCEGDVPAMLSMAVTRALTGVSGFQANPARINPETGEILFAHCTIPLNMCERYEFDTHFESGIGVGIRGYMANGPVTIFKISGDLKRSFVAEGELLRSQAENNMCRTQQVIRLDDKTQTAYFLNNPIGNHHIILPGHWKEVLDQLF